MTHTPEDLTAQWATGDPLGEALHFLHMRGVFYCASSLGAPWGLEMPALPRTLMFHVVLEGACVIEVGDARLTLRPGELALVPHGRGHTLRDAADSRAVPILSLEREHVSPCYERLQYGGSGARARLVCGAVRFDHPSADALVALLPSHIHVEAWPEHEAAWVDCSLRLMASEAQAARPGGEAVMTRLADILIIQAIRAWLESPAHDAPAGWLRALRDERIGRALAAMHRDPGADWSLPALAAHCGMSRSAFAARFTQLVGESPAKHLTRWRMQLASARLREGDASIGAVADALGYASQAAFSRAFKRHMGVNPRDVQRDAGS